MAQLVEHILGKDEVISSNLISSSRKGDGSVAFSFFVFSFAFLRFCEKALDIGKGGAYNRVTNRRRIFP